MLLENCTVHTYVLASFLTLLIVLFLWDTIRTFLQVTRAILGPYFIPLEDVNLIKKFGTWARKLDILFMFIIFFKTITSRILFCGRFLKFNSFYNVRFSLFNQLKDDLLVLVFLERQ